MVGTAAGPAEGPAGNGPACPPGSGSPIGGGIEAPERGAKADNYVEQMLLKRETEHLAERSAGSKLLRSTQFNLLVGSFILANAVLVGVETDEEALSQPTGINWLVMNLVFNLVFLAELVLRLKVDRLKFFLDEESESVDLWNCFDFLLVVIGVADVIIQLSTQRDSSVITTLRTFRLLRLARLVRLVRLLKALYFFVSGIASALAVAVWAFVLLALVVYICSVFLVRAAGAHDPEHFGDVITGCRSLFRIMTLDSWYDVTKVVNAKQPLLLLFFVVYVCVCSYALVAVMVAVVTQNTLRQAEENEEETSNEEHRVIRNSLENINAVFQMASERGSSRVSSEEFRNCLGNQHVLHFLRLAHVSVSDAENLFFILDYEGRGSIEVSEFVEGCLRSRGGASSKDVLSLECDLWRHFASMRAELRHMQKQADVNQTAMLNRLFLVDARVLCLAKALAADNPELWALLEPLWDSAGDGQKEKTTDSS